MLKVVGASWLQTRISTYLLISVGLLGIMTFIFSEFGRVEDDGTYSATVFWNKKEGYRIEFWGQRNNLQTLPQGVARAYYKTGIYETGWSILEIETQQNYPDEVQAFAAGLLEGSLTWQLIHHHWYNTIRAACAPRSSLCKNMRRFLHDNRELTQNLTAKYREVDPYWHMIDLFEQQLKGLEYGWKYAVHRTRQSVSIKPEDFYYLAVASDLMDIELAHNGTYNNAQRGSTILLKSLSNEDAETIVAFAKNTAASYSKMLRLIKKYKFAYHLLPNEDSELVPGQSVIMTSFPGALSSQDENYVINGEDREMVVAGIPIFINNRSFWNRFNFESHEQILSPARIMAANRLSTSPESWTRNLMRHNSGTSNRQWISYEPHSTSLWLVEQIPGLQYAQDYSKVFKEFGLLVCAGVPFSSEILAIVNSDFEDLLRLEKVINLQKNVTNFSEMQNLMQGEFTMNHEAENQNVTDEDVIFAEKLRQIVSYRGDLDPVIQRPIGIINSVGILMNTEFGIKMIEARSGPPGTKNRKPFSWSERFLNVSHIGHPDTFDFAGVKPHWAWI